MTNIDVANIDLFILINQGLDRLEKHLKGEDTPLNNPIRIIEGVRSSLNTVRHNYQSAYQDIDNVIAERDDRDNQILRLQQDVNRYRQLDTLQQNHINQLTQDGITLQNRVGDIERSRNFWKLNAIFIKTRKDRRISTLLHEQFASQLLNRRETQQLKRQLQQCHNHGTILEYWRDQLILRYEKWKNKTKNERQIILADQNNIRRLNRQMAILKIQIQWFRFRVINLQINPLLPVIQQPRVITSWLILH